MSLTQKKKGEVGTSIKANHILQRLQPDPIMLLAAAAAVIDDEGKYKGRSYERREIKLQTRRHSKLSKIPQIMPIFTLV